jgi:hypothetical protein
VITTSLAQIKQAVADKTLFYTPGLDEPVADGGQFEFKLQFKSDATDLRVVEIDDCSHQLSQIMVQMAQTMTDLSLAELPDIIKQASPAQFGLHMLEGSNKGRFVIAPQGDEA